MASSYNRRYKCGSCNTTFTHGGQLSPTRNIEDTIQDVDVGEWLSAHELNIYYSHVIDPIATIDLESL
jgi:hypothetical protein